MRRAHLNALVVLAVALAGTFVSDAEADNNNPPRGGSGDVAAFAWGRNDNGQLGDGTTTWRNTPVQVQNLSGTTAVVVAVAGGTAHSLALKSDGTVWAWGFNGLGGWAMGLPLTATPPCRSRT
jgi:Regulator of chromosome condensation (RCC1) repeat